MQIELIDRLMGLLLSPQIFIPLIYPGLLFASVLLIAIIYLERKMAAKVQLRYGPLYVSKPIGGALQLIADALRLVFQEPIIPRHVDLLGFLMTPIMAMILAALPIVVIPIAPDLAAVKVSYNLPLALAFGSIAPIFIIGMGWASNNKFSLVGGVREALMVISYEVALFLSAIAMAFLYGSLDMAEIVDAQARTIPGILVNPFAAFAFFVATVMSASRLPFDIVEGEQEIVVGPFTEYSGLMYAVVMGAGYIKLYMNLLIFSALFLAGWHPIPGWLHGMGQYAVSAPLVIKALILMIFVIFLRCVYGRYRLDHAIRMGWRRLIPLSIISAIFSISLSVVMGW